MLPSSLQSEILAMASKSMQGSMLLSGLPTWASDECFKQGLHCVTLPSSLQPLNFGKRFN